MYRTHRPIHGKTSSTWWQGLSAFVTSSSIQTNKIARENFKPSESKIMDSRDAGITVKQNKVFIYRMICIHYLAFCDVTSCLLTCCAGFHAKDFDYQWQYVSLVALMQGTGFVYAMANNLFQCLMVNIR